MPGFVLLVVLLGTQPNAPDRATAIELARGGQYVEALDAFRRLAALNPADHEARIWIARLHVWMGHPDQAEDVYRSVLLENPANLDAILGLGEVLLALNAAPDAIVVLERGRIVEIGRHDELLANPDGTYATLYQLQLLEGRRAERKQEGARAF
jgi:tetratricopeptide (TPR) repeat protein